MRPVLLIDFGSTCTKLTAVDLDAGAVLGNAQDFTTADKDISLGYETAHQKLRHAVGALEYEATLACSSAAGGLRMVACGLVTELTAKAARIAAYGAGAKVIKTFSYRLTNEDGREIEQIKPDILLLCGGTDGGNSEVIEHNAAVIASLSGAFPVVYAGNRAAKEACVKLLSVSGHAVYSAQNVMPTFGVINEQPVQEVIRDIFLQRIVHGKGLSRITHLLDGILMPTPSAVLNALTLLSRGTAQSAGLGDLMAVDLGGATTDVYSIASGDPTRPGTFLTGLREPYVKRTVEGDIGMRYGAKGVLDLYGKEELHKLSGVDESMIRPMVDALGDHPHGMPHTPDDVRLEGAVAALAVRAGLVRHAGNVQQVYTPVGPVYQQTGKDLSNVGLMVLTGGALIYSENAQGIMSAAVEDVPPGALIPREFRVVKDTRYILSAMGLLASYDEQTAFSILQKHFGKEEGYATGQ